MSMGPQNQRRRRIRRIIIVLVVLMLVATVGGMVVLPSVIMGPMVDMHVSFSNTYDARDYGLKARELTLYTEDGYAISAFEVDAEDPRAVLIFISGIHNPSVTAFFGHAQVFRENGYASILYDMRAHGKSDGELVSLGYLETRDTQAVVDYILTQERYQGVPIIVYGLSMGGAVAINSAGQIPEIAGLVSISAYSSWEDVFADSMVNMGLPQCVANLQKPFVKLYSMWKFGWSTRDNYPAEQIKNLGNRPALLMHSDEDSQVSSANLPRILQDAPNHVETWTRPGDEHFFTADFLHPEGDPEYVQRVLRFLTENFE